MLFRRGSLHSPIRAVLGALSIHVFVETQTGAAISRYRRGEAQSSVHSGAKPRRRTMTVAADTMGKFHGHCSNSCSAGDALPLTTLLVIPPARHWRLDCIHQPHYWHPLGRQQQGVDVDATLFDSIQSRRPCFRCQESQARALTRPCDSDLPPCRLLK